MHSSEEIKYIQQQEELNNVRIQTFEENTVAACLWWKGRSNPDYLKSFKVETPRRGIEQGHSVDVSADGRWIGRWGGVCNCVRVFARVNSIVQCVST